MKRTIIIILVFVLTLATTLSAYAAKPEGNQAGVNKVAWNLSADVMPAPPYGSRDIPGSDTASKLIVNQPNGNTKVAFTGVMKGLHPETTYLVYLSKGYTPFTSWPGLFTSTIQPFSFVTDEFGEASWHLNMKESNFSAPGTYMLSVWVNESGRTMLISDNFQVVVE